MARINLTRKSSSFDKDSGSYKIVLEVVSTENINKHVFIQQRLRDFVKNNFTDVFVAVATPAQIEDFDINSPAQGDSHFRVSKIELLSRNIDYLEEVFQSILRELQDLVDKHEALQALNNDGVYSITANQVTVNDEAIVHNHYRIPLTAKPSGTSETFTVSNVEYQRVTDQDTDLPGWLNNSGTYKFKYNIEADTTLSALWPPASNLISYAHLEVDGITIEAPYILINAEGIFWKNNAKGSAPWPIDYVDEDNEGTEEITLILDFVA